MNQTNSDNFWPKAPSCANRSYDPSFDSSQDGALDLKLSELEVALGWQKEWKETVPDYRFSEALNIFPEARPAAKKILQERLKIVRKKISDLADERQSYIERNVNTAHFSKQNELMADANEKFDGYLASYEQEAKRIKGQLYGLSLKDTESNGHQLDINRAKDVPIKDIIKPNRYGFIRCPFHNDHTPSMRIYKHNAYCFAGCGNKDGIDLVMAIHGLDFKQAVMFLMKL